MQSDLVALQPINEQSVGYYSRQPIPTLRDLASVLFRQRRPLLIVFVLAILGVACSGVWIPSYEGHMKIMVLRQRTDTMVSPDANAPPDTVTTRLATRISTPKSVAEQRRPAAHRRSIRKSGWSEPK